MTEKIRLHRDRVVTLDAEALKNTLMVAYELCTDWTEFICTNNRISKHPPIDDMCVLDFFQVAFEELKRDLKEESRKARPQKQGPVGFAAPETAALIEKDGPRSGLITKVVVSYANLRDTLTEWKIIGTWLIVFD
ncbi:unnamed protein product [Heligmosomoides polygyrus]|uniref:Uncharacterized protein n=1 Tax=Heligmosomoides polygyrus TaxID=6339 RepID=A0A183FI59_HELPZ|nr:unnamed protein product [Heligmosomoides polygyrus]